MAVNPQKLLPPAKLSVGERMAAAYDKKIDDLLNLKIKKKLINVDKVVNTTKKVKEKTRKQKKTRKENEEREKKEGRLEQKQPKEASKLNLPSLPRTGIFDTVQNFLGYTFLGYILTNYSDKLSPLRTVVSKLPAAMDTFGAIVRGTVDFAGGLIEGGYKFRNDLSQQVNELGGKDAQKTFDTFTNDFKNTINSIMTLGLYKPPKEQTPIPQQASGGYVKKMAPGGNITREGRPVGGPIRRGIQKVETKTIPVIYRQETQPGKDIGGRKVIERIFPSSPQRNQPGPLNTLMTTSSTLSRVPFIGPLMSAAIDIAMGQKPDKRIYRTFGDSLAYMLGPSIDAQANVSLGSIVGTIAAMAEGGAITRGITKKRTSAEQIGIALGNLFEQNITSKLTKIFAEILKTKSAQASVEEQQGQYGDIEYGPLPLGMTEKQAFATIYELAKKSNASMPELVAGMAMHESGYLGSPLAREYNNPFGQTGNGPKGSVKIVGSDGKERTFAIYNNLGEAVKWHVDNWNNNSKYGKGLGTYGSAVEGLKAGLPTYAPTSDGNNHANYIRSVSSILSTMGFDPKKRNKAVDLSTQQVIQKRKPLPGGTITGTGAQNPNILSKGETVVVEGRFRLRPDAARAYLDMKRVAASDGVNISLTSAWRDSAQQAYLYELYQSGQGNLAAAPGTSKHEMGIAIDLASGIPWAQRYGSRFGWINTGMTFSQPEPWHFDFDPSKYKPSSTRTQTRRVASVPTLPAAEVASSKPKIMNAAQQLAMEPSYASSGGGTTLLLKEKIILKEVQSPGGSPTRGASNIDFPGVNSTVPTLIG